MADDFQKFYAPSPSFQGVVSTIFESLLCLDNPEDVKFFGNFNTDLGNQIEIAFIECQSDKDCLSPEKRKSYLVDAFLGDPYIIIISN